MEVSNAELMEALKENTELTKQLLELLKINNKKTIELHESVMAELTPEAQLKAFGYNTLANVIGNTVAVPTIINFK